MLVLLSFQYLWKFKIGHFLPKLGALTTTTTRWGCCCCWKDCPGGMAEGYPGCTTGGIWGCCHPPAGIPGAVYVGAVGGPPFTFAGGPMI